jgi:hypothetical protein
MILIADSVRLATAGGCSADAMQILLFWTGWLRHGRT